MKRANKQNMDSNLWLVDNQGNMKFSTRTGKFESIMQSNDFLEKPIISMILMLFCALLDFFSFKQLFGILLYDHPLYQAGSIVGFLILFDVGAVILGYLIKRRKQGFNSPKMGEWFLIGAIGVGVMFVLWLRIVKKDELVPLLVAADSFFKAEAEEPTSDLAALPYAIVSGLLPLGTTIVSIIASYIASNPLKKRLMSVRKQKVEMESKINEIHSMMAELNADKELGERLDEQDIRMLKQKVLYARELGLMASDYVRERIKEHVGEAACTNELSKNVHNLILEQHFPVPVTEALIQMEKEEFDVI